MTFFANSGLVFSEFEEVTRIAGANSMEAASRLWKLFAALEKGEKVDQYDMNQCAEAFKSASSVYSDIAQKLQTQTVEGLTTAELDLAALRTAYRNHEDPLLELFHRSSAIPIGKLYLELSQYAANLSSAVRAFKPDHENRDLAAPVFQMMKQWESAAILGRIIAVLNRRQRHG